MKQQMNDQTLLQHGGAEHRIGRGVISAMELAITFETENLGDFPVYARLNNTANHLELNACLAQLHQTEKAMVFASGMAAMSTACFAILKSGDHVLAQENCYGTNQSFLKKVLPKFGVNVTFAPIENWKNCVLPQTKICFMETISNPFCIPQDFETAKKVAHGAGALLMCDNTFASPILVKPILLGVDLVLESATKYLNGHSDVVAGVVAGKSALMDIISETANMIGGFLPTFGCTQLLRGMRTLEIRVKEQNKLALEVISGLSNIPQIKKIYHGSLMDLPSHVRHNFKFGFGAMLCLQFSPNISVEKIVNNLQSISHLPSLGGTETTCAMPIYTTHALMTAEEKKALNVDGSLLRMSVGLENPDFIVQEIANAIRGI